jgi:hypothetical protein
VWYRDSGKNICGEDHIISGKQSFLLIYSLELVQFLDPAMSLTCALPYPVLCTLLIWLNFERQLQEII